MEKRWDEFQSYISIAEAAGVPCRLLTPEEYEFPRWFAASLQEAIPEHGFRRTTHMQRVQQEVKTIREDVGFLEMSPMTKFTVRGPDAAARVDRIMANKLPRVGRMALSVVCNKRGGINGEYTIQQVCIL